MVKLSLPKIAVIVSVFCAATAIASPAQTYTTLVTFDRTDGLEPGLLTQGTDGNFYGTTDFGGRSCGNNSPNGCGTIFKVTPAGVLTTLHFFCSKVSANGTCLDGWLASPPLVQALNGNFYGTTVYGGATDGGSVFAITPEERFARVYSFCSQTNCTDGASPSALLLASNGKLYGTTFLGGSNGKGTVFQITPGGLTTLYNFCAQPNCADGWQPGALIQATGGDLYGTTASGGANGVGTVFKIDFAGKLTTVYSFVCSPTCGFGVSPGAMMQATDGNFYGVTAHSGAYNFGTVFELTPAGVLTTLYNFCPETGCADGSYPNGLIQATDGNFYGTTLTGGLSNWGTIFEMTPGGTLTTLHLFNGADGAGGAGLLQATDGTFYGTTQYGGSAADGGTVYSLSTGLAPFVKTQPSSGKAGTPVAVLGTDLTGSTSVAFNGTAATFTVVSSTEIATSVPDGATTGKVKVVTPSGTLTSNVNFRVP